jgi:hypothetical protein
MQDLEGSKQWKLALILQFRLEVKSAGKTDFVELLEPARSTQGAAAEQCNLHKPSHI